MAQGPWDHKELDTLSDFTFFLSCGILVPRPETESTSPALQADSSPLSHQGCRAPTIAAAAAAKSLQSCLTLCDPIDESPPGSAIPGILQTRTLEWVAISFSNA